MSRKERRLQRRLAIRKYGRAPVNPIGTCFDTAAFQLIAPEAPPSVRLCHGIGIANLPGQEGLEMAHAWIELVTNLGQKIALDTTWGDKALAERYRQELQLSYVVEYTQEQALELWKKHDYPGPWDERILAITERNKKYHGKN